MFTTQTRLSAVAALILTASLGAMVGGGPAWAGGASTSVVMRARGPEKLAATATLPSTDVVKIATGAFRYQPTSLSATWSGPHVNPTPACTPALGALTVTNTTGRTQTIMHNGKPFGTLLPHYVGYICLWGTGSHVFGFALKGSSSRLTVTVT
jgi:hypothetical protein